MARESERSRTAADLFAEYLAPTEAGESFDFEAFCATHPGRAQELRALHQNWQKVRVVLKHLAASGSLTERIHSRYGSEVDPLVSLEGEGEADLDFTSEVLERLAGRGEGYGRYRLKGEIARGGQGAVLRVWDEDLRRHLAMKVVLGKDEETGETPQVERGGGGGKGDWGRGDCPATLRV